MTIATLPVGYSDGITMEPAERLIKLGGSNRYWGLLRGHQVPFVGRCGIAHVLIDASALPQVRIGEEVTVPVRRTAASARLPRLYKVTGVRR
jgi:alanine racemase